MLNYFIVIFVLTMIIHTSETLSYSLRYAGVKINKIAVALSLTGIVVLISRTANLIQAPLTGNIVDYGIADSSFNVLGNFRVLLLSATIGTLLAILLFPTFVNIWGRVISRLELAGSLPNLISSVTIAQLKNTKYYVKKPTINLSQYRYLGISKRFIVLNILVTAIYTVGVLSSLYAAYLVPELRLTASQSSGLINGIATILLTIFIDPQIGLITDKAMNNEIYRDQLGKIYNVLMLSRLLGTLLAQALLLPASMLIATVIKFM